MRKFYQISNLLNSLLLITNIANAPLYAPSKILDEINLTFCHPVDLSVIYDDLNRKFFGNMINQLDEMENYNLADTPVMFSFDQEINFPYTHHFIKSSFKLYPTGNIIDNAEKTLKGFLSLTQHCLRLVITAPSLTLNFIHFSQKAIPTNLIINVTQALNIKLPVSLNSIQCIGGMKVRLNLNNMNYPIDIHAQEVCLYAKLSNFLSKSSNNNINITSKKLTMTLVANFEKINIDTKILRKIKGRLMLLCFPKTHCQANLSLNLNVQEHDTKLLHEESIYD